MEKQVRLLQDVGAGKVCEPRNWAFWLVLKLEVFCRSLSLSVPFSTLTESSRDVKAGLDCWLTCFSRRDRIENIPLFPVIPVHVSLNFSF